MLPAMSLRGRITIEGCVAVALGATVFAFALGSSSVASLHHLGAHLKWAALVAMVPVSVALALGKRPFQRPAWPLYVLAGLLLLLAFDSALWSVAPVRTLKLSISLGLLFVVAAALGIAATRPQVARALVIGVSGGAVAVAVGGVIVFFVHHGLAVTPAIPGNPERFQGLTENPNTASLLAALVLPLALWQTTASRSVLWRAVAGVGLLLLFGTIVASGSKGALGAAFVGTGLFALTFDARYRPRFVLVGAVVIAFASGVGIVDASLKPPVQAVGAPVGSTGPAGATGAAGAGGHPGAKGPSKGATVNGVTPAPVVITPTSNVAARLADEIGSSQANAAQGRTLLGTSGRAQAWVGAIHIGAERPVAGYGFGTEDRVFVDRWFSFEGDRPENSYIGIFLQLGLVGLALLISIGVVLISAGRRVLRSMSDRALGAACFGTVAAGATLAIAQSYIYAVGDIGTLAFWSTAFVLAGLAGPTARRRA